MNRTLEEGRWVVELRPSGIGRWVSVAFLTFWLAGWVVGEAFGLTILLATLGATAGFSIHGLPRVPSGGAGAAMFAFAVVWVGFWTLGGVGAASAVLSMVWGVDRILYDGAGVRRVSRTGPFTRTRDYPRDEVRGVSLRRTSLVLETGRGVATLTRFGSRAELVELRAEIERALALGAESPEPRDLPAGWESAVDLEGIPVVQRSTAIRRRQAAFVSVLFAALAAGVVTTTRAALAGGSITGWAPVPVLTVLASAALAAAGWLWLGGEAIRLRSGQADVLRWFGSRKWLSTYSPVSIALEHSVDSDGDDHYRLVLRGAQGKKTVGQTFHEPYELQQVGRWMAPKLGCTLELPSSMRPSRISA